MKLMPKAYSLVACATLFMISSSASFAFEALPEKPPIPKDNPMTPEKIELGKQLYFDPRLSKDGTVSCNSCHNVMSSGTDNRPVSVGVDAQKGGRSAPTVWNAAYLTTQFWDGRAKTLEDQAKGPILNSIEMGMPDAKSVVKRVKAIPGYVAQFEKVFGGKDPVTYDNIAKAIATFERTLVTPNSPFDRYVKGDKKALSADAQRGMKLVESVGCVSCHSGPNFAGPGSLAIGEGFFQKFPTYPGSKYDKKYELMADLGLQTVTKKAEDKNMWRVPTWRNVATTAPYFHNGSVATLDEAVRVMAKTQLNKDLKEKEVKDIVAFLNSLTGEFPKIEFPRLPDTPNQSLIN
ncbi:cytochrome-c peroxidase [Kaarinaea lacus]